MDVDKHVAILRKLSRRGIRYVVVGVSGINFYADDPGHMFSTQDLDIVIKPVVANLRAALKALFDDKFHFEANGEPVVDIDQWLARRIIEHSAVITAKKGDFLRVDLVLEAGKLSYDEWEKSSRIFNVRGCKIRVGKLADLIRAKEDSNRDKDRKFLGLYKAHLKEMLEEADAGGRKEAGRFAKGSRA